MLGRRKDSWSMWVAFDDLRINEMARMPHAGPTVKPGSEAEAQQLCQEIRPTSRYCRGMYRDKVLDSPPRLGQNETRFSRGN